MTLSKHNIPKKIYIFKKDSMSDSVLQVHVKLLWTKQNRIKCYFNLSLLGLQGGAGTYPSYHRATGRVVHHGQVSSLTQD